jgi:nucleoside 2-deoxyribosyltransferase
MKTIYIAGPMSGYPEFNYPAFDMAEKVLRKVGFDVFNPATNDANVKKMGEAYANGDSVGVNKVRDFREVYLWDITKVIEADGIYMLMGWQFSPGAIGEHSVAVAMKRHYPEYEILYQE